MSLTFEKLDPDRHEVRKVAELVLDTDHDLMPLMFGAGEKGVRRIACLIRSGNNTFGHEQVYAALDGSSIAGIAIGGRGDEYALSGRAGPDVYRGCCGIPGTLRLLLAWSLASRVLTDRLDPDDFYVIVLCVDPDRRGGGVGTFIMEHVARIARERQCSRIVLDVSFKNERGMRFYERMGFECVKKKRLIPGWDGAGTDQMVKALHPSVQLP